MPPKKAASSTTAKKVTPVAASKTATKTTSSKPSASTAKVGPKGTVATKQAPLKKGVAGSKTTPTGKGAPATKKSDSTADKKGQPKKKEWTKSDEMARRIQTAFRGYRCRKMLLQLKQKQDDYDKLMDKLEKEVRLGA
jgi:hypothetical protein